MSLSKTSSHDPAPCLGRAALAVISMAAGLGLATQGANALTTYQAQVTCPIDGATFTATMVSSFYQQGMRLDSKPLGSVIAPYPYPVCPGNGFVIYQNEFTAGELGAIKAIVLTDDYRRLRSEHTDYYMVAYVKERLGDSDYDLGNMYLRASWEAERDKPQLVRPYQTLALAKYDAFLKRDTGRTEDWWAASVVAAELDRLLGNFDATETRLNGLPPASNIILRQAINQIRAHAHNHNAKQEELVNDAPGEGTVGSARPR